MTTDVLKVINAAGFVAVPVLVRKGSPDQPTAPFQFDIHIGPDVASKLISNLNAGVPGFPLKRPR